MADEVGDDVEDAFIELETARPAPPAEELQSAAAASQNPPEASGTSRDPVLESAVPVDPAATEKHTRHFEFTGGNSNKFWEITLAGPQHTVRFGRIGTKGQIVTKTFEDIAVARQDCERLIRSKQAKGYREE